LARRDVLSGQTWLQQYNRGMADHAPDIFRIVGWVRARAPPAPSGVWPWLKGAWGCLISATRRLVTVFQITPFQRYQCHQPMGP
jgi:hypothetical protein